MVMYVYHDESTALPQPTGYFVLHIITVSHTHLNAAGQQHKYCTVDHANTTSGDRHDDSNDPDR